MKSIVLLLISQVTLVLGASFFCEEIALTQIDKGRNQKLVFSIKKEYSKEKSDLKMAKTLFYIDPKAVKNKLFKKGDYFLIVKTAETQGDGSFVVKYRFVKVSPSTNKYFAKFGENIIQKDFDFGIKEEK